MCYEKRNPEQARACFERDQRKEDYISRKALLEDIENTIVFSGRPDHQNPKQMGARMVVQRIRCAPAADVAPVVHGRWVLIETGYGAKIYECSECKDDDYWKHHFAGGFERFCPNCGARMDGE